MPDARKLQGWLTIRGPDGGTITQDEDEWVDLWDYQDIVLWFQVTDASNVLRLEFQTSPVRESGMFVTMESWSGGVGSTPEIRPVTSSSAPVPLARYVRWRCIGRTGGTMSLTFRAWIAASGRARPPQVLNLTPGTCECESAAAGGLIPVGSEVDIRLLLEKLGTLGVLLGLPAILKGKPLFVDPCMLAAQKDQMEIAALEQQKKNLQEELKGAAPGQKPFYASEILFIQKQINNLKKKVGAAYQTCCKERGGNENGSLATTVGFASLMVFGTAKGKPIGPFQLTFLGFGVSFKGCWNSAFKLTNLKAPASQQVGDVTLSFSSAAGEGMFNPTTGAMAITLTLSGAVSSSNSSGEDELEFELSTENAGGTRLTPEAVFPDKADAFLTGEGTPKPGGLLAGQSATFTAELNVVGLSPLPFVTPK